MQRSLCRSHRTPPGPAWAPPPTLRCSAASSPRCVRLQAPWGPARRQPRQPAVRARAAANLSAADGGAAAVSGSSCPFLAAAAPAAPQQQLDSSVASLAGPGGCWRVLPQGNTPLLPEPQGRWCLNPLLGEYGELERRGAGAFLLDRFKEFGPVFAWQLGGRRIVTLVDYDTVSSLLKLGDSRVMLSWNPPAMYDMLGEGARVSLENPTVRMMTRRHLAPGFSREALRGYMGKLVDICASQLDAWAERGAPVDLTSEGKALSFEFSTQLLVEFDIPADRKAELKAKFDALFQGMLAPPINLPGTRYNKGLKAKAALLEDISEMMRQRQRSSSGAGTTASVLNFNLAARQASQGRALSDRDAAEAGIGLIIAGNDTSGLGVTALLAVLPHFPEVLARLREEQRQLVSEHGPEITVALLDAMPYAEAVVREVLRLAPPSAQTMRRTLVDMEIGGKFIRAGTLLQLSSYMGQVLTDPRLRPDSLTASDLQALHDNWGAINLASLARDFRPERWLAPVPAQQQQQQQQQPGDEHHHHQQQQQQQQAPSQASLAAGAAAAADGLQRPSTLLTFSQGPHACLGMSLFMAEAKVLLALIARGYKLAPPQQASAAAGDGQQQLAFDGAFITQLRRGGLRLSRRRRTGAGAGGGAGGGSGAGEEDEGAALPFSAADCSHRRAQGDAAPHGVVPAPAPATTGAVA